MEITKEPPQKYITTEELKKHNKAGDLWISIHGKVYDVSEWAHHHPGGDYPLLTLSGQDATDAFTAHHPNMLTRQGSKLHQLFTGFHLSDYHVSGVSRDYRRLTSEFSKMGLFDQKGHWTFYYACVLLTLFSASVYGVVFAQSWQVHLLSGLLLGAMWVQAGWVGHDSGHYDVMMSKRLSCAAGVVAGNCLTGVSMWWWKLNHNAHHLACNVVDYDPDIQLLPFFAVSTKLLTSTLKSHFYQKTMTFDSLARFLVSYQHYTFYPVMLLVARVNMFVQSWVTLLSKKRINASDRCVEILGLIVFWIWYPFLISKLPNIYEQIMFVVANLVVTGVQQIQFSLNHLTSHFFVGPLSGENWVENQSKGSLDISCDQLMDWFHGGLQFQIEHHLFPRRPRCQLRRISPYVKDLCVKHGLEYNRESFWSANTSMFKSLRDAALRSRDLTVEIAPQNLVWEALNNFD